MKIALLLASTVLLGVFAGSLVDGGSWIFFGGYLTALRLFMFFLSARIGYDQITKRV